MRCAMGITCMPSFGIAVGNDGSDKVGYTAPSVAGQAEVIARRTHSPA